jgi:hypothetical protein
MKKLTSFIDSECPRMQIRGAKFVACTIDSANYEFFLDYHLYSIRAKMDVLPIDPTMRRFSYTVDLAILALSLVPSKGNVSSVTAVVS